MVTVERNILEINALKLQISLKNYQFSRETPRPPSISYFNIFKLISFSKYYFEMVLSWVYFRLSFGFTALLKSSCWYNFLTNCIYWKYCFFKAKCLHNVLPHHCEKTYIELKRFSIFVVIPIISKNGWEFN